MVSGNYKSLNDRLKNLNYTIHKSQLANRPLDQLSFSLINIPHMILNMMDMLQRLSIGLYQSTALIRKVVLLRQCFDPVHNVTEVVLGHRWEKMMLNLIRKITFSILSTKLEKTVCLNFTDLIIQENEPPVVEPVGRDIGRVLESKLDPVLSIVGYG